MAGVDNEIANGPLLIVEVEVVEASTSPSAAPTWTPIKSWA
jgi:hypothetical protein